MIRLVCPECQKDSYTSSVETLRPCPYCGFYFSGKYYAEKRDAYSAQKEIPVQTNPATSASVQEQ